MYIYKYIRLFNRKFLSFSFLKVGTRIIFLIFILFFEFYFENYYIGKYKSVNFYFKDFRNFKIFEFYLTTNRFTIYFFDKTILNIVFKNSR